jgi:hypothetical protein
MLIFYFQILTYKSLSLSNYASTFVMYYLILHLFNEKHKNIYLLKTFFLNSQAPKLRFFVLCFGFNQ